MHGKPISEDAGTAPMRTEDAIAAGDFGMWLLDVQAAIRGERSSEVPCGACTGCCTSSQFVHIGPDEVDTLAHIPKALLFPAPRRPKGHVLLGYDEQGRCPMLVDDRCSIYEHRPQTCRTYDCRIFPASGVGLEGEREKVRIDDRVRRWRFDFATQRDRTAQQAIAAAATFLDRHRDELPAGAVPQLATQLAALAIEMHDLFLAPDAAPDANTDAVVVIDPPLHIVNDAFDRR